MDTKRWVILAIFAYLVFPSNGQDYICSFEAEVQSFFSSADRTWRVTREDMENYGLQGIVNCTSSGDSILIESTDVYQPDRTIHIPWSLTIGGEDNTPVEITCPSGQGLFLIKAASFLLENSVIKDCDLPAESSVRGLVETDTCASDPESPFKIELSTVAFRDNRNLGGSLLFIESPSCYSLKIENVEMSENTFATSSFLPLVSQLNRLQVVSNVAVDQSEIPLFALPSVSTTTIDSMEAENNRCDLISVSSGSVVITNSSFIGNKCGGLRASDETNVTISDSLFDSNDCSSVKTMVTLLDQGFGFFDSVEFRNNSGTEGGVAVLSNSTAEFTNCVFYSNSATIRGGSIVCEGNGTSLKSITITSCNFTLNRAPAGGCIDVSEWKLNEMVIKDSRFVENVADNIPPAEDKGIGGGAIRIRKTSGITVTIFSTSFLSNRAHNGAGIHIDEVQGSINVSQSIFKNNSVAGQASRGSGMSVYNQLSLLLDFQLYDSIFEENSAEFEGALYFISVISQDQEKDSIVVTNTTFTRNRALQGAAFVSVGCGKTKIEKSIFDRSIVSQTGGAIRIFAETTNSSKVTIRDSEFVNNTVSQNDGGAILAVGYFSLENCNFVNNSAAQKAGAIMVISVDPFYRATDFSMTGGVLSGNSAKAGGALAVDLNVSRTVFDGVTVENNSAVTGGGILVVIRHDSNSYFIRDSAIRRNNGTVGGGLFLMSSADSIISNSRLTVENTMFTENRAKLAGGGIFVADRELLSIDCNPSTKETFSFETEPLKENVECDQLQDNRVEDGGYGMGLATALNASFRAKVIFKNKTTVLTHTGAEFNISGWRGGDELPDVSFTAVDDYGQGPALGYPKFSEEGLPSIEGTASVSGESPERLFPDRISSDMSAGTSMLSLGGPLREPGNYTVVFFVKEDKTDSLMMHINLRECIINEQTSLEGRVCVQCDGSHYNFDPDRTCSICPPDTNCTLVYNLPMPEYWNPHPCSNMSQKCIIKDTCKIPDPDSLTESLILSAKHEGCDFTVDDVEKYREAQCRDGYKGVLCGSCEGGYGRSGQSTCSKCPSDNTSRVIVLCAIAVLAGISYFQIKGNLSHLDSAKYTFDFESGGSADSDAELEATESLQLARVKSVELIKIFINFVQTAAAGVSLDVSWSRNVVQLFRTLDWTGGTVAGTSAFSLDCLFHESGSVSRSIKRQIFICFIPLIVFVGFTILWVAGALKSRDRSKLGRRCILSAVAVLYVSYISLTKAAVAILYCVDVNDGTDLESLGDSTVYWAIDTSVVCFEGGHLTLVLTLAIPLLLVAVIFPATLALTLLYVKTNQLLETEWVQETLGLLFRGYDQRVVFWDAVILLRKALLACIVGFAYSLGGYLQGELAIGVLLIALFLQTVAQPFKNDFKDLNLLENISLFINILSFLSGIILNNPKMTSGVAKVILVSAIFIMNLGFIIWLARSLFDAKLELIKQRIRADGADVHSMNTVDIVKLFLTVQVVKFVGTMKSLFKRASQIPRTEISK